ncbi:hypothetical protein CDL15_Pgr019053 [Punica granatum]|uniref:Uncharacterized protein n=1 Tax=Punica granatum TaxID=22663 RepID=A0A218XL79_PUNGR|nr:hypothetical protein CDL15_Pgr019053 [Punica granatum]
MDQSHCSSSYLRCMSPSCFPVNEDFEYSRIPYGKISSNSSRKCRKWRNLIRRIVRDSKNIYRPPKPVSFHYDAVSYSQNFDDGYHV